MARIRSIKTFLKHMTDRDICAAMELAHAKVPVRSGDYDNYTFKYFCGICWSIIKGKGRG